MTLPPNLLTRPPDETYKDDARSTVWRTDHFVIKRYNHAPLKQWLAYALRLHPGQLERRKARGLATVSIPCVQVEHVTRHQGRVHTVTRHAGESVQRGTAHGWLHDRAIAPHLLDQLAARVAELIEHQLFFRDLQAANLVRDDAGTVHLLDVGSLRRSTNPQHADRMLAMLIRSLRIEGATRTDGLRLLQRVLTRHPQLADSHAHPTDRWRPLARRLIAIDPRVAELHPKA